MKAPLYLALLVSIAPVTAVAQPQWIWAKSGERAYFRRLVDLARQPDSAEVSIACDNSYVLYVNGLRVGEGSDWTFMQTYDLRRLLHKGRNLLAVEGRNLDGPAGMLAELTLKMPGSTRTVSTDSEWRVATERTEGWTKPELDEQGWDRASVIGPEGIQPWGKPTREADVVREMRGMPMARPTAKGEPDALSPDPAKGMRWSRTQTGIKGHFQRMAIAPVAVQGPHGAAAFPRSVNAGNEYRLDFGREIAGWVEVEVEGDPALPVGIRVGEGTTPQSPFPVNAERLGTRTVYRLLPTGSFTGFRFAWLRFAGACRVRRVEAVWRMWPANYEGSFACSDLELTRIWNVGAYTAHLNLDPVAFSAILRPERGDRYPWLGDDRVMHRTVMDVFGDYDPVRADLDYFVKPDQKGILINGIPGYTLDWVIALYDYWMSSGDLAYVKRRMPDVQTILSEMDVPGTPPGWLFTDWEPGLQSTSAQSVSAFRFKFEQAALVASKMAAAAGSSVQADAYRALVDRKRNEISPDPESLGVHAMTNAILAGRNLTFPASMPTSTSTPYFSYYVLEALSGAGEDDRALEAIRRVWGGMVRLGATSTWEYFRPEWVKTLKPLQQPPDVTDPRVASFFVSQCHPWSSGATAWLTEHVLGITPAAPGFESCRIKPYFGPLNWAKGAMPSPKGPIEVSWKRTGRSILLLVAPPVGVGAEVVLPPTQSLRLDGKAVPSGTVHVSGGRSHEIVWQSVE